jgi:hypothetical protein
MCRFHSTHIALQIKAMEEGSRNGVCEVVQPPQLLIDVCNYNPGHIVSDASTAGYSNRIRAYPRFLWHDGSSASMIQCSRPQLLRGTSLGQIRVF